VIPPDADPVDVTAAPPGPPAAACTSRAQSCLMVDISFEFLHPPAGGSGHERLSTRLTVRLRAGNTFLGGIMRRVFMRRFLRTALRCRPDAQQGGPLMPLSDQRQPGA
jgi:hypothetical protein